MGQPLPIFAFPTSLYVASSVNPVQLSVSLLFKFIALLFNVNPVWCQEMCVSSTYSAAILGLTYEDLF